MTLEDVQRYVAAMSAEELDHFKRWIRQVPMPAVGNKELAAQFPVGAHVIAMRCFGNDSKQAYIRIYEGTVVGTSRSGIRVEHGGRVDCITIRQLNGKKAFTRLRLKGVLA